MSVHKDRRACKVRKDLLDHKAMLGHRAIKVCWGLRVRKDNLGRKDLRGLKVPKANKDQRDHKANPGLRGCKVIRVWKVRLDRRGRKALPVSKVL